MAYPNGMTFFRRVDGKLMKERKYLKLFRQNGAEAYHYIWIARPVRRQLIHKGRKP